MEIPLIEYKEEIRICSVCGKKFSVNSKNYYTVGKQRIMMGCTTYHELGSCCHFNDTLIEENNASI